MGEYRDVAQNSDILKIANAIRAVTSFTGEMTIKDMPRILLETVAYVSVKNITATAYAEAESILIDTLEPSELKHMFFVYPTTEAEQAKLLPLDPKANMVYDAETGELELLLDGEVAEDIEIGFTVVHFLLKEGNQDGAYYLGSAGKVSSVNGKTGVVVLTASDVGADPASAAANAVNVHNGIANAHKTLFDKKVDKETGKGLSTEDYTTAEKTKLSGIDAGAEVNIIEAILDSNGQEIEPNGDKQVELSKAAVGLGNVDNTSDADKPVSDAQQAALNNKVDKVEGKGLSTNDFTDNYRTKLYLLPLEVGAGNGSVKQTSSAASGQLAAALGNSTRATHNNAFTAGEGTNSGMQSGAYVGKYNDPQSDDLFEVGNGTDGEHRSNAIRVKSNGQIICGRAVQAGDDDNTLATKRYVDDNAGGGGGGGLPQAPTVDGNYQLRCITVNSTPHLTFYNAVITFDVNQLVSLPFDVEYSIDSGDTWHTFNGSPYKLDAFIECIDKIRFRIPDEATAGGHVNLYIEDYEWGGFIAQCDNSDSTEESDDITFDYANPQKWNLTLTYEPNEIAPE